MAVRATGGKASISAALGKVRQSQTPGAVARDEVPPIERSERPVGILPLVHIRHVVFGNNLVSLPFFDFGGFLYDDVSVKSALLKEALGIASRVGADRIEVRYRSNLHQALRETKPEDDALPSLTRSHKVRMVMELPGSSQSLMKSFKSKLRSQITKALRGGLEVRSGGEELLDEFYSVFSVNMRDLGSPVHSKRFFAALLGRLSHQARVFLVSQANRSLAASVVFCFKDTVMNPWASSLRRFSSLNPNMLLYWAMMAFACDNGFRFFDFGRSTPGEGTYRFKEQWGAKPEASPWQFIFLRGEAPEAGESLSESKAFNLAGKVWQRLPVAITRVVGPPIRKYISL
jgi:FemAB-related protein (PEP-CTERM system-associated)